MTANARLRVFAVAQAFTFVQSWAPFYSRGPAQVIAGRTHSVTFFASNSFRANWGVRGSVPVAMSSQTSDGLGGEGSTSGTPRVLGLGSAGVDFIAAVDRYPAADAKVRTESLEIMGGGNCGNTLSAASRLGLDACLVTKVGSDANGRLILDGLQEEGVDVSRVIVSESTPSAFTYIIVDKEGGTRTCIHTPQTEDTLPTEITPDLLDGVAAVHLDSRHTLAAIALATLANERGIPVVLDAEKDRPHLQELLPLADYIICNRHFPEAFTRSTGHEAAIRKLLDQGRARLVATTLGADGCIVVSRENEPPWQGFEDLSLPSDCPMDIKSAVVSDATSSTSNALDGKDLQEQETSARYVWAPSWPVEASSIVDTTGAGDCFIAAFIYGVTRRLGIARGRRWISTLTGHRLDVKFLVILRPTLALASLVAGKKLSQPGARRGVPNVAQLEDEWPGLLSSLER